MLFTLSSAIASVPLLFVIQSFCIDAHSWIDCIDTDRSKIYDQSVNYIFGGASGNGYCGGYGAGFPGRGENGIGPGYTYKMLRNEVEAGVPVCQIVDPNTYSDWRKRISLTSGQKAFFAYLPNGHIVKDKKAVGTQHGIYWTGKPNTALLTTHDMKPEHLINGHTMNYDDGNCGETFDRNNQPSGRAGDGKPCIGSFDIPAGTTPGIYKMVWYWTFWLDDVNSYVDQSEGKGYFGAAYSTCFEVEVLPGGDSVEQIDVPGALAPLPNVSQNDSFRLKEIIKQPDLTLNLTMNKDLDETLDQIPTDVLQGEDNEVDAEESNSFHGSEEEEEESRKADPDKLHLGFNDVEDGNGTATVSRDAIEDIEQDEISSMMSENESGSLSDGIKTISLENVAISVKYNERLALLGFVVLLGTLL
ncbi:hypothetical protein CCR75_004572 [Bremia lactucae]|uniref:Uncharacterized protein n=1 Tax=Bremia lactucae TaxID=4779 RepID=A0A976IHW6_BRELC|nr:hypothetical protein CCR75_004572 [Bremia lactucae]